MFFLLVMLRHIILVVPSSVVMWDTFLHSFNDYIFNEVSYKAEIGAANTFNLPHTVAI